MAGIFKVLALTAPRHGWLLIGVALVACGGRSHGVSPYGSGDDSPTGDGDGDSFNDGDGGNPALNAGGSAGGLATGASSSVAAGGGFIGGGGSLGGSSGTGGAPSGGGFANIGGSGVESGGSNLGESGTGGLDSGSSGPTSCNGPISLSTPEEVAALAALQCDTIYGDLGFAGAELLSLSGLEELRVVEGTLRVYFSSALTDFSGLSGLRSVEGDLNIGSTKSLVSLAGLDALEYIGGAVIIDSNAELTSIEALGSASFATPEVFIRDNLKLASLLGLEKLRSASSLWLRGDNGLIDLQGLSGLESVEGDLTIELTTKQESLLGLEQLVSVGGHLRIESTSNLTSIAGLSALETVGGDLTIKDTMKLSSLAGMDQLATVMGNLNVENNAHLVTIGSSLPDTFEERDVSIIGNPALENLNGLEELSTMEVFNILDNALLADTSELVSLQDVTFLIIRDNALLQNVSVPNLETAFQIEIDDNNVDPASADALRIEFASLSTLQGNLDIVRSGELELVSFPLLSEASVVDLMSNGGAFQMEFPSLTSAYLSIGDNPDLLTVAAFPLLPPSDYLLIYDNPHVPQCEVEAMYEEGDYYCVCYGNDESAICE